MYEEVAQEWRTDIEEKLKNAKSTDLLISYQNVAVAFPSSRPHLETLDHNCIDGASLKAWAKERGWEVMTVPEMASDPNTRRPPIRLKKIAGR